MPFSNNWEVLLVSVCQLMYLFVLIRTLENAVDGGVRKGWSLLLSGRVLEQNGVGCGGQGLRSGVESAAKGRRRARGGGGRRKKKSDKDR